MAAVRVPSVSRVTGGLYNYAIGAGAGWAYTFLSQYVGGLVGSALLAAGIAAVVPGNRGEILTTVLGFNVGASGAIQAAIEDPGSVFQFNNPF